VSVKTKFQAAVALQVRLPLELRQKLEEIKEETGKSVNRLILEAVENHLEKTA
jgi:predicted DNA-binding protein